MTSTENRPDAENVGPAKNTRAINGAETQDTAHPYGLRYLDEDQRQFVLDLDRLSVPLWIEDARPDGHGEFRRPRHWQDAWAMHNNIRLAGFEVGRCICANTGGPLIVVDVDPRNGGDIEAVRQWLAGLSVRIFAEVITPSRGCHFYIDGAWREDFRTVHGKLPGLPGVDIQAKGANVFLPGTRRPKYDGKGYKIVLNDLAAMPTEGDPEGAQALATWIAEHAPRRAANTEPGQPWDGTPPDARQRTYLDAVLANAVKEVAEAVEGCRNDTLNRRAFTLGQYVAGAGMDCGRAEIALLDAAERCGLPRDEAETSVTSGMTAGFDNPRSVPERGGPDPRDLFGVKARQAPAGPNRDVQLDDLQDAAFWQRRDNLAQILRYSRARRAAPYAVLGCLLRRAIALVPPNVHLPPIVGDNASVNFFTVSVGRSGQGKGIASAVARRAVEFVTPNGDILLDPPAAAIGSGEGLARIFRGYGNGDELAQVAANVEVSEVSSLAALADRKGGTLVGELLKAYMGEPIGFQNAQRTTTTSVAPHSYRLCLGVGAQPENTDVFLSREKDGLPQRFLWLPTIDPLALRPEVNVEDVDPARVVIPTLTGILEPDGVHLIRVTEKARRAVRDHHYLVSIGSNEVDPLDKHLMLVQLKAAFGLALLDGRGDITEEDWDIASHLIEVSNRTRARMRDDLADRRKRENSARAHAQADRQTILDDRLTEERQRRISGAILRKLDRQGKATRRELSKAVTHALRPDMDAVLDILLDSGDVVARSDGCYELGSR